MYQYKWIQYFDKEFSDAKMLRVIVFMDEQGFIDEFDDFDKAADHLVVYKDNKPIATSRLLFTDENNEMVTLGRICVLKEFRGKNIGRIVMDESERHAKEKGFIESHLGAQMHAKQFYEKVGYTTYGEEYLDQESPHIHMKKAL